MLIMTVVGVVRGLWSSTVPLIVMSENSFPLRAIATFWACKEGPDENSHEGGGEANSEW